MTTTTAHLLRHPDLLAALIAEACDQLETRPDLTPITVQALRNLARDLTPAHSA